MAIPFVLPSEEDNRSEVELEQLLGELIGINRQIQNLLQARMQNRAAHTSPRVCTATRHHQRHQTTTSAQPSSTLPDLVRSTIPAMDPTTDGAAASRHHRINADAEAACCYHAKFTTHMLAQDNDATALPLMTATAEVDVDWKQVGDILRRFADIFKASERLTFMPTRICASQPTPSCTAIDEDIIEDKGLLAKIIPATTSSRSLWTAVICVVGWHIFRAR